MTLRRNRPLWLLAGLATPLLLLSACSSSGKTHPSVAASSSVAGTASSGAASSSVTGPASSGAATSSSALQPASGPASSAAPTSAASSTSACVGPWPCPAVVASVAALVPAADQSKTLTFALDPTYPPFSYYDTDGKTVIGLQADVGVAALRIAGIKFKVIGADFNGIVPGIQAAKYDMSSLNDTKARNAVVDFVDFYQSYTGLLVPNGNPQGLSINTLCGKAVAVQSTTQQMVQVAPSLSADCTKAGKAPLTLSSYTSGNDVDLALLSGRAVAALVEQANGAYIATQSQGKLQMVTGPTVAAHPIGLAVGKGSGLAPVLEAAIKQMMADGTYKQIFTKWNMQSLEISTVTINGATS